MTELTEGVNTYRVIPIIMRDRNADSILEEFRQKIKRGETLTRQELSILTLCPPNVRRNGTKGTHFVCIFNSAKYKR